MKLKYTILYVEDVFASIEFYEKAFGLGRGMIHESGEYGELDTGATTLAFSSRHLMQSLGKTPGLPDLSAPTFELAFETDDVDRSFKRALEAGASSVQQVRDEPWGQRTAYVLDNNGYLVEICSIIGA